MKALLRIVGALSISAAALAEEKYSEVYQPKIEMGQTMQGYPSEMKCVTGFAVELKVTLKSCSDEMISLDEWTSQFLVMAFETKMPYMRNL